MKRRFCWLLGISFAALLLTSCGDEIARISLAGPGEGSTEFSHNGGTIVLWSDFSVKYQQRPFLQYQVEFYQKGDLVAVTSCSPLDVNVYLMKSSSQIGGVTTTKYQGKMKCDVSLPAGTYTVSTVFSVDGRNVEVYKSDLVLRSSD